MMEFGYPEPYKDSAAKLLLNDRELTKSGWMYKKAGRSKIQFTQMSNYDKRFFVLLKGWVYYYKDQSSAKPQGFFSLQGYSNRVQWAEEESNSSLPWVFRLHTKASGGRTWYFAPETEPLMNEWKECFKFEIEKYNICPSNLRVSRSLPEKGEDPSSSPMRVPPGPVSRSFNGVQKKNIVGHSSVSSSQSTSTSGSAASVFNPSAGGDIYEKYPEDSGPENYLTPNEINKPLPPAPRIPGTVPFSPTAEQMHFFPQSTTEPDNYEVVDPDLSALPTSVHGYPTFQGKLPLSRVESIPQEHPPEPPAAEYEEPSELSPNRVGWPGHHKALPPVPAEVTDPVCWLKSRDKPLPQPPQPPGSELESIPYYHDSVDVIVSSPALRQRHQPFTSNAKNRFIDKSLPSHNPQSTVGIRKKPMPPVKPLSPEGKPPALSPSKLPPVTPPKPVKPFSSPTASFNPSPPPSTQSQNFRPLSPPKPVKPITSTTSSISPQTSPRPTNLRVAKQYENRAEDQPKPISKPPPLTSKPVKTVTPIKPSPASKPSVALSKPQVHKRPDYNSNTLSSVGNGSKASTAKPKFSNNSDSASTSSSVAQNGISAQRRIFECASSPSKPPVGAKPRPTKY